MRKKFVGWIFVVVRSVEPCKVTTKRRPMQMSLSHLEALYSVVVL